MIVVGVDPGDIQSAVVAFDTATELIRSQAILSHIAALEQLRIWNGFVRGERALLAIEQVQSYGMPVGREIFETVWWSGRLFEVWSGDRTMLPRMAAKMHLCGSSRAKDPNIRRALIDRLGPTRKPGPLY